MPGSYACATIFFHIIPEELIASYEQHAEPANGYLVKVGDPEPYLLVDAQATETADWVRQVELATLLSEDEGIAFSVFQVGEHWALALAYNGQPGPTAVFAPDARKLIEQVPRQLLALEKVLLELFPTEIDQDAVDVLFGEILEGVTPVDEAVTQLLAMLGCPPNWLRWSWYETIPEQIFTDPDLLSLVTPLGEAKQFWE